MFQDEEDAKVSRETARAEAEAQQASENLRLILASYGGRAFIWDLLGKCGLYADSFRGEDTHATARATGKRAIALGLVENIFTADPNSYTLMRLEYMARVAEQEKQG